MKLLIIGDPHFRVDNIPECELFITQTADLISSLKSNQEIDAIVVLGDILHTHEKIHTLALNMAIRFFDVCRKEFPTYVLVGNHDATSNTIFLESSHWMNALKGWNNIFIIDQPTFLLDTKDVLLCPYVPDGRFVEALNTIPGWKKTKLICGHQLLNGAKMGAIVANGIEEWLEDFPPLISGHIHDKQRIKPNLLYVGSSMQHAFGETADKTLLVYDVETKVERFIELNIPKKKIMYVNATDIETAFKKIDDNHLYKIVIRGDPAECKAIKSSSGLKRLKDLENVKRIQIKEDKKVEDEVEETDEKDVDVPIKNEGFLDILKKIVEERNDIYVTSLFNSCLELGEDISENPNF